MMNFRGKNPATMTRFQFEKQLGGEFKPVENTKSGRSNGEILTWTGWSKERQEQMAKFCRLQGKTLEAKTWKELADRIQVWQSVERAVGVSHG